MLPWPLWSSTLKSPATAPLQFRFAHPALVPVPDVYASASLQVNAESPDKNVSANVRVTVCLGTSVLRGNLRRAVDVPFVQPSCFESGSEDFQAPSVPG